MTNHKNSFFIKEGPKEVNFDMSSVFLDHLADGGKTVSLHSEEIKDLLDEKLLRLDDSLKQRHSELVDYLRKVEGRISRVEDEILGRGVNSLKELDGLNVKVINPMGSQNDPNVKDNDFDELVKKDSNLPNVSLDQEELDALLEGLNEISRDDKKGFSSNLENDSDIDISFETTSKNEFNSLDANNNLYSGVEKNIHDVVGEPFNKEGKVSLGVDSTIFQDNDSLGQSPDLGMSNVIHSDGNKLQEDFITNLGEDNQGLIEPTVDQSLINSDSDINVNSHLDNFIFNEVLSDVTNLQEGNSSSYKQDNFDKHDFLDYSLCTVKYSDKNLEDLDSRKFEEEEDKELSNFNDINASKMDGVDVNLSDNASLHKGNDGIDSGVLKQKQEIDDISSGLKKLDNFEDVLKADLNCVDLQDCIQNFEEKNLYDNEASDLEEKVDQYDLKDQDIGDNSASDFSFADVEAIINKFDDNEYLSKIKLGDKERTVLVKFISRLESDLDSSPKGNSFKIKKEYEILQKIKRLLIRE
ncbi:hypothetical protein baBA2_000746 [Borrelia anserina]|uniref:Uncharacterized protein n=2 Tax=Borrelia anserina TaxID=143 RepID=W5SP63_BORAN|nr:hypothetical protein [Borrelia anserina]AHH08717.1 Hypothetical protein BAN_0040300 [Borrelia anserina BA2]APR65170.1 hypothetical protein N187_03715 [Borrelia anserina Es]UPA07094.1 hypothetical protein baBA2_000746 [Borrelia anserina]